MDQTNLEFVQSASSGSASHDLATALADGAALVGSSSPSNASTKLQTVLKNRLEVYYDRQSLAKVSKPDLSVAVEDLQLRTAKESLSVLHRVQAALDIDADVNPSRIGGEANPSLVPPIGTRDLALLRTLLSISFKWGLEPLFVCVSQEWPSNFFEKMRGPQIVDLTTDIDVSLVFSDMLSSMFSLVFPEGPEGRISQTLITTTILTRHTVDLLLPTMALGWLPDSFSSDRLFKFQDEAKPLALGMLKLLHPAQAIVSLGSILSSSSSTLPKLLHVRKACASLLTRQLLRPDGVQGLFEAMFSADEVGDEVNIEKLEQIARTLNSAPTNMIPLEYYRLIFPKVLKFLTSESPPNYRRAAAFIIFRAVDPQKPGPHRSHASSAVLEVFHRPFLDYLDPANQLQTSKTVQDPRKVLSALTVLLSNTEPSPTFISKILSPILASLYLLSYDLDQIKTVDPFLKETVNGLLMSWGKIVDNGEGSNVLWSIIEDGKDSIWTVDLEGRACKIKNTNEPQVPLLFLPRDVQDDRSEIHSEDALQVDLNLFNLYPDPVHFVEKLKAFDRADISSALFLRLLENYRDMKSRAGEDSMRLLHKLQIIVQMQNRLSEGTTSSILRKSDQLLSFIFNVLASATIRVSDSDASATGKPSARDKDDYEEADSDDETADSEIIGPDDELIETTITLLLSILEADEALSPRTQPILNDVFSKLELLALNGSSVLRPLAREARLVITARLASAPSNKRPKQTEEDPQEVYQKALKLLQDPILPVRAHGLLLLRQLASLPSAKHREAEKALMPSILSIFLQCVHDDDSYMFLNAVQGLSALASRYGKEILHGLVNDYAGGLEGLGAGNLTQQDIDVRTRIGEALGSVIKQCGNTLGLYVDTLVPRLYAVVRGSNIATTLRTSALSLLADCVDTYPWAMLPYIEDLCQAMIDLLQIESLPIQGHKPQAKPSMTESKKAGSEEESSPSMSTPAHVTMDSNPTLTNSKFPPLRRAALHFLSLLIRASTNIIYDEKPSLSLISGEAYQRILLTLGYVSSTDEDSVVRVMAREAKENLEQMRNAIMGL
ncbi:hypothetical protein CPB84DRAFT_1669780 [Gymnopilus junonius]|uniref:RNA polymerase II assembly factor Rtp1 C-terminal domain-containing protein n=1 Tax=Gymnopilus junonius TaxID=109634 RepID=A0A9P5P1T6_GYMJU|nr:hypothetical protein CPB84DRAFT_1669780 [Gymnopilus junonius]